MRPRRLVTAVLLAGGAVLTLASPAGAAAPRGAWTSPAPSGTAGDLPVATLERPGPLAGWAEFEHGIAGVGFTLVEPVEEAGDPCSAREEVLPQSVPGGGNRVEFAFDAPFPCNQRYQVRATVAPQQRPLRQDTNLVLNLLVDVALPPAPAEGVTAEVADDRTVSLGWTSGEQAPDFEGFQIERAVGDEAFRPIGEAGPTDRSFTDGGVPDVGGTVRYRVVAMRPGPAAGTTVFAEPSPPVDADVPAVPGADTGAGGEGGDGSDGTTAEGADGGGERHRTGGTARTVRRVTRTPVPSRPTTATTIDTGYEERLPFEARSQAAPAVPPPGDPAVVARLDGGGDDEDRRQNLLLVAGGTTAFSWAMLLRVVSRRALVL